MAMTLSSKYPDSQRRYRGSLKGRATLAAQKVRAVLRKYGLSIEQYEILLEVQGGVCAICRNPPPNGRRLGVDHDHATGRVRGLLCIPCNVGLGCMRDDPTLMEAGAAYLRRS